MENNYDITITDTEYTHMPSNFILKSTGEPSKEKILGWLYTAKVNLPCICKFAHPLQFICGPIKEYEKYEVEKETYAKAISWFRSEVDKHIQECVHYKRKLENEIS